MPLTDPPTPSAENQRNNKSHCWPLALHLLPTPRQMVDVIILSNSVSRSTSQVFTKLKWRFCFSKWADEMQRDADVSNIIYLVRYDYIHLYFQNRHPPQKRCDAGQYAMAYNDMRNWDIDTTLPRDAHTAQVFTRHGDGRTASKLRRSLNWSVDAPLWLLWELMLNWAWSD